MPTVRHYCFLLRKLLTIGIPKSTVLVIIFRVFIWRLSFKNEGKKIIIHMQNFEIVLQEKVQDRLIMTVRTTELLCRILIMKRHPKLRNVSE